MMKKIEDTEIVPKMAPCPQCGQAPGMSHCCGEYFVFGIFNETDTCFCTRFTEMHSSMKSEVEAWNKAASNYKGRQKR